MPALVRGQVLDVIYGECIADAIIGALLRHDVLEEPVGLGLSEVEVGLFAL